MAFIHHFEITEPPTSYEVKEHALEKLRTNAAVELGMLATDQQVPKPVEQSITLRIRETLHPRTYDEDEDEIDMVIGGEVLNIDNTEQTRLTNIRINIARDESEPATATMIIAEPADVL